MDDINVGCRGGICHAQPRGQRLNRGVGILQLRVNAVDIYIRLIARSTHAVHIDVNAVEAAHETSQFSYVNTCSAVNLRRVFLGHHGNTHSSSVTRFDNFRRLICLGVGSGEGRLAARNVNRI